VPAHATSINQIGVWMSGDFDYSTPLHGAPEYVQA
jgi:simple sugar transport system ATP-binding protein